MNTNERLASVLQDLDAKEGDIAPETVDSIIDDLQKKPEERVAVKVTNTPKKEITQEDEMRAFFPDLEDVKKESSDLSTEVHEKQATIEETVKDESDEHASDSIDDILESITGVSSVKPEEKPDSEKTYEEAYNEYENSKLYSTYTPNDYQSGPSDYIVEYDNDYLEEIDTTLEVNGINTAKVSDSERRAMLNRYTNSGPTVSLTLPNSGIFITMSGAGLDELIAMANINNDTITRTQIAKMKYIADHIVTSSVGKLSAVQMMNIVSYYDIPTLYYALFAATHPDVVEPERKCPECGQPYYIKINTRDLLLNYKDFEKTDRDIKDNVTTYSQLKNASRLSKVYIQYVNESMVIYYKHPSIASFINTLNQLSDEKINEYPDIAPYTFSIKKISLKNYRRSKELGKDVFVDYDNPNHIVDIIGKSKDPKVKYRIEDIVDLAKDSIVPEYGFHATVCPHCGKVNKEQGVLIDELLFTTARADSMISTLERAIVLEKRKKDKSIVKE